MNSESEMSGCEAGCGCLGMVFIVVGLGSLYTALTGSTDPKALTATDSGIVLAIGLFMVAVVGWGEERREKRTAGEGGTSFEQPGMVYLLKSGPYHKIGATYGLDLRLRGLQTGSPHKIEVIHTIRTAQPYVLEKELHAKFSSKRVHGEWFNLSSQDVRLIKRK